MPPVEERSDEKNRSTEAAVRVAEDQENLPDGGLRAWLMVAGCFIVNATTVGFW
jgi:hypothetical protein